MSAGRYVVGGDRAGPRATQVARRIETDVVRRGWPVGQSLGSEQALQDTFGVSRSVLREAVRLVEHHQVARMRRGPGGGLVVTAPDAAPAIRATVIYLEYLGITLDELLGARMVLEPVASELAAERIDEAGIDRLRALLRAAPTDSAGDDLHAALAELTGNPVLALFVDVLTRLTVRYATASPVVPGPALTQAAERQRAEHSSIVDAVTGGDGARAKTLTEHHVRTVTGRLAQRCRPGRAGARAPALDSGGKRAEVLAAQIHEDIAAGDWPIGTVFGAEADLLHRYGVSRSVLREAVRLLEHHTVARMRRGPGGGLIITEPQPDAIIDTIALYLEYRHPSREDLRLVRDAIELANVAAVVRRRTDADVADFLARQPTDAPDIAGDFRLAGLAEFHFHADLAELAGNRVLSLFLRILVELFRRHWISTQRSMPGADDAADVHRAHLRIVAAMADGDASMAQHRFRRHLDALSSWWL